MPYYEKKPKGMGDVIHSYTQWMKIPHCDACEKTRQWLNEKTKGWWMSYDNPLNQGEQDVLREIPKPDFPEDPEDGRLNGQNGPN